MTRVSMETSECGGVSSASMAEQLLTGSREFVALFDQEGRVRFLNPAGRRLLGLPPSEPLSELEVTDLYPPNVAGAVVHELLPAAREYGLIEHASFLRTRQGQDVPVSQCLMAHFDPDGALCGYSAIARDVSGELQLRRQLAEISARMEQRIGQELHDSVAQNLVVLNIMAARLHDSLVKESPRQAATVAELARGIQDVITVVRALVKGLMPRQIKARELASALCDMTVETRERFDIACHFHCQQFEPMTDDAVANELYRIAQEAIHNAVKHGRCQNISLDFEVARPNLRLVVRDDGVGMRGERGPGTGLGLQIMQSRASVIGATLNVHSEAGVGTEVRVTVGLPANKS